MSNTANLRALLANLEGRGLAELVDALLPAACDECGVLREVALLATADLEDVSSLFERIKTHVTQPEMPEEGDFVRVMHKSKGLTSRITVVAGCTQGLIPFQDDEEPPAERAAILREQRRLFYVAITRCTEMLVLSSAVRMERETAWKIGARLHSGRSRVGATIASQFIDELGPTAPAPRSGQEWTALAYAP